MFSGREGGEGGSAVDEAAPSLGDDGGLGAGQMTCLPVSPASDPGLGYPFPDPTASSPLEHHSPASAAAFVWCLTSALMHDETVPSAVLPLQPHSSNSVGAVTSVTDVHDETVPSAVLPLQPHSSNSVVAVTSVTDVHDETVPSAVLPLQPHSSNSVVAVTSVTDVHDETVPSAVLPLQPHSSNSVGAVTSVTDVHDETVPSAVLPFQPHSSNSVVALTSSDIHVHPHSASNVPCHAEVVLEAYVDAVLCHESTPAIASTSGLHSSSDSPLPRGILKQTKGIYGAKRRVHFEPLPAKKRGEGTKRKTKTLRWAEELTDRVEFLEGPLEHLVIVSPGPVVDGEIAIPSENGPDFLMHYTLDVSTRLIHADNGCIFFYFGPINADGTIEFFGPCTSVVYRPPDLSFSYGPDPFACLSGWNEPPPLPTRPPPDDVDDLVPEQPVGRPVSLWCG